MEGFVLSVSVTVVMIIIKMNRPISVGEASFQLVTGGTTFTNSKAVGKFEAPCLTEDTGI